MIGPSVNGIKVSVIVPVLNEEKHIDALLSSLVTQTYPADEMEWILIDGGSKDATKEIINGYLNDYPIGTLLRCSNSEYTVMRTEQYYIGNTAVYTWAILQLRGGFEYA